MSTSIAVLGASGYVGSALCAHVLRSGILEPGDRLQLVGHGEPSSYGRLLAIRADLLDAFDDLRVSIDVAPQLEDIEADLVVLTAGVPMPPGCTDRRVMGRGNLPIFRDIANACGKHLPTATYLVVSNPVELAVQELSRTIDRKRIIGIGAEQDSLRFARSIARSLGISRHDVHASVWGEHGRHMIPMWHSVRLRGDDDKVFKLFSELEWSAQQKPLMERVANLQEASLLYLQNEDIASAYHLVEAALPDARIFIEPFVTASAIHSTPNATANAVLNIIRAWKEDDGRCVHAQVMLQGELHDISCPFGVPVSVGSKGWILHPNGDSHNVSREELDASIRGIQDALADASAPLSDLWERSIANA
ncbi:hypothetical protein [Terriglobus sp. TAA 43]|uniref:lactate/malate family dehydrogenase n=1 Tax=Terriglobus sp. TAA 43 TaxID=278961 RepID=UPI00068C4F15|nr:hypothetical protein [Terriglobus sp. TAA 43]